MKTHHSITPRAHREGFTIIEILIPVILILALVVYLGFGRSGVVTFGAIGAVAGFILCAGFGLVGGGTGFNFAVFGALVGAILGISIATTVDLKKSVASPETQEGEQAVDGNPH